jgi:hypothetical protein
VTLPLGATNAVFIFAIGSDSQAQTQSGLGNSRWVVPFSAASCRIDEGHRIAGRKDKVMSDSFKSRNRTKHSLMDGAVFRINSAGAA